MIPLARPSITCVNRRHLATFGCRKRGAVALLNGGATQDAPALRRRTQVEMLRSFSVRAYLAARALRDREEGQALVEYALLLSLIAIVSIVVLGSLGHGVSRIFSRINSEL